MPSIVYCGLGGNLGNPIDTFKKGILSLSEKLGPVAGCSHIFETKPLTLNGEEQPNYYNAVAAFQTVLEPQKVLEEILKTEISLGRVRSETARWTPRTIDIDVLMIDGIVLSTERLVIPHPEMHKRDFVLVPLAEIAPEFIHPVLKKSIRNISSELAANGDDSFVLRRLEIPGWEFKPV